MPLIVSNDTIISRVKCDLFTRSPAEYWNLLLWGLPYLLNASLLLNSIFISKPDNDLVNILVIRFVDYIIFDTMKEVSDKDWKRANDNLNKWRKNRKSPPNLDLYKKIVSMVHVGKTVLDVGCGPQILINCLPGYISYRGIDPFPLSDDVAPISAEQLNDLDDFFDTVFMLAALDNVKNIELSLKGLKHAAKESIVILTSIGVPKDKYHTHTIEHEDLERVLGNPYQKVELLPKVWLFEWRL